MSAANVHHLARLALVALLACACAGAPEKRPPQAPAAPPADAADAAEVQAPAVEPQAPGEEPAQPAPRPWDSATAWPSSAGSYVVRFRPTPEPMPDNEVFALDVWVFDPAWPDAPLEDVELSVDAGMPQHGHGMNVVPTVARQDGGRFRVDGMLFHMTGEWQVYFDVTRGPVTERAQYPVMLE